MTKFNVITVTYNAVNTISETLKSIVEQDYDYVELTIVDGGSTDGTIDLIRNFELTYPNVSILIEEDDGIYDAMNKAISLSTADYVVFMNAGDRFSDNGVISFVYKILEREKFDLVIGNTLIEGKERIKPRKPFTKASISMPSCHQSIFYSRKCIDYSRYDLTYKLAADFKLTLELILKGASVHESSRVFSLISSGGVSDINRIQVWREYEQILNDLSGKNMIRSAYYKFRRAIESLKSLVKGIIS